MRANFENVLKELTMVKTRVRVTNRVISNLSSKRMILRMKGMLLIIMIRLSWSNWNVLSL